MACRISKIWKSSHPPTKVRRITWTCCKTISNFMIGRIKPRIRDRQPSGILPLMWVREWLLVAVALCTAANAAPPAPAVPPVQPGAQSAPVGTQPPPAGTPPPPSQGAPDGDFIEFLGGDDVGDAAW